MSYRILIVDDSKLARMYVAKILNGLQPGWTRIEAADAGGNLSDRMQTALSEGAAMRSRPLQREDAARQTWHWTLEPPERLTGGDAGTDGEADSSTGHPVVIISPSRRVISSQSHIEPSASLVSR